MFKAAAEKLAEEAEEGGGSSEAAVDVAAVNCHKWPALCSRFDVRAYPSVKMVSGGGMVQDAGDAGTAHVLTSDAEALAAWARETAGEWRWLFAAGALARISGEAAFTATVLASPDFWVVLLVDGVECGPCRTARTNLMRLSASAGKGRVRAGLVDCESETPGWGEGGLCARLGLPRPPHAPVLRAFHRGNKTEGYVGESLYNPAELESHVALRLVEAVLRLSMEVEPGAVAVAGGAGGGAGKWDKDPKEEEEGEGEDKQPPPPNPPRVPKWNGPPPRAIPAGGFGGGGGGAAPAPMLRG